jgi:transcription antitermination factor NusG
MTEPLDWYAIRVSSGREYDAERHLREHGFRGCFVPSATRLRRTAKGPKRVKQALIPGYLFLPITTASQPVYAVARIPDCIDVVRGLDGNASPIRREVDGYHFVYAMQAAQAAGEFDFTPRAKAFAKGQSVTVTGGKWKGLVGRIKEATKGDRATVMLDGLFIHGMATIETAHIEDRAA